MPGQCCEQHMMRMSMSAIGGVHMLPTLQARNISQPTTSFPGYQMPARLTHP
jgi:hypothetical protein